MGVEQRRFPRIPFTEPGELHVPIKYTDPDAGSVSVTARFRDISCQGAELIIVPREDAHVVPGTIVELCFTIEAEEFTLPARVVWAAASKVGLRLKLGSASDDVRRAYAGWIVPRTNKAIAHAKASALQG